MNYSFTDLVLAAAIGAVLGKVFSLFIDLLVWVKTLASDISAEVCKRRNSK